MEVDADSDFELSENTGAEKVAARPKAKNAKVLQQSNARGQGPAIEDIYQKKTPLEHILLRPDTYVGSTEKQHQKMWVHDGESIKLSEIDYVPGLYKIFDEILVNAADNKVRDPKMDMLKVEIDKENNRIMVWNNGDGVPVEIHKEEKVYVPEMIFGHLLTSSNYDDTQKKVTGGRNGYGAKLANIFSTEFVIETCDGKRKRQYCQVFRDNMATKGEPKITFCKASENWTCVTFHPDLAKFGMTELEDDAVSLMRKRVYDLAGVLGKGVKVLLNGERLPIKSFKEYVELYLPDKDTPRVHERVNDRWEVVIAATQGQFQQVSFVNSICTIKGGTHVNYLADQICKGMVELMSKSKEHKKVGVKPFMVKNHLSVFVNCMVENPAFDSQTKETLTLRAASFGSKCELSDKFIKKVGTECGLLDLVASYATFKGNKELKKSDGAKRSRIPGMTKLMDANDAASSTARDCTLILTEGDSAKSLVVGGLSVAGRDKFGVFPLRGKLLNVRDASTSQISSNVEIQNIKSCMGLQHGQVYNEENINKLRYGHLMIMTDQDHDGSHIKGLIMNFFHHFYPSLLKMPGFLLEFITPIVKASKGKQSLAFYTMPEYESWAESVNNPTSWTIKYYKGLGTSTEDEAQEYFADINRHRKAFIWQGDEDAQSLELAFSKKRIEERKTWLQGFSAGTFLDQSADEITYTDFVNKELILFSRADLERSIPSMVDGLKPGQRKILYACFKKDQKKDIKVAQLSGYVSEHSAYHHGETSLQSTIVGLAQSFVGSNNINLLVPSGQFGTRLQGGKDAASARYIFTRLEDITRTIFHKADDKLLNYLNEEGQDIEPEWYMPILPLVLVNGAEGIGTGWSTFIPNFNPRDIVDNLRRLLKGEEVVPMHPWYKNFKGTIADIPTKAAGKSYACNGIISKDGERIINITELPIRKWTQDYKEFLETLIKPEDRAQRPLVVDYKEFHTGANVHFELQMSEGAVPETEPAELLAKFKLTTKITLSNMVLFDKDGLIKRYSSPEEILRDFYELRLDLYGKRRDFLIQLAESELLKVSNKMRFILAVIAEELKISNRKKADIESDMENMDFDRISNPKKAKIVAAAAAGVDEPDDADTGPAHASYDYLLSMPIQSLTLEKVQLLRIEEEKQQNIVAETRATTPKEMYAQDLDAFIVALEAYEGREREQLEGLAERQRRAGNKSKGAKKAQPVKKKTKKAGADSDDDVSDDDYAPKKGKARKPIANPAANSSSMDAAAEISAPAAPAVKPVAKRAAKPKPPAGIRSGSQATSQASEAHQPPREESSLMDRVRGRLEDLSVQSNAGPSKTVSQLAAKPKRATAAKTKAQPLSASEEEDNGDYAIEMSDSDDDFEELPKKAPPAKKSTAPRGTAKRKPAEEKAQPAVSAVSRLQQSTSDKAVESPIPAPQGKVRRMRPSPFHKGSGGEKMPAPVPKKAAMKAVLEEEISEVQVANEATASETFAAMRPSRRAAASKTNYVEEISSNSDSGTEEESEFDASELSDSG